MYATTTDRDAILASLDTCEDIDTGVTLCALADWHDDAGDEDMARALRLIAAGGWAPDLTDGLWWWRQTRWLRDGADDGADDGAGLDERRVSSVVSHMTMSDLLRDHAHDRAISAGYVRRADAWMSLARVYAARSRDRMDIARVTAVEMRRAARTRPARVSDMAGRRAARL
jgi:hypothetical protein